MEKPASQRPLHFLISADLHQRLKVMAAKEERSVSAEARKAIEDRLSRYESEPERAAA